MFKHYNIEHTGVPVVEGDLEFHSDAKQKYHVQPEIPARIMVEEINGNKRIAAKSIDSLNAEWTGNTYSKANMTIKGRNGATGWGLTSLKIGNAHFNRHKTDDIEIRGYRNGSVVKSKVLEWRGTQKERTDMELVSFNWDNLDSVVILGAVPFALDDVVANGTTASFSNVSSVPMKMENGSATNDSNGIAKALPLGYEAYPMAETHPKIVFTGNGGGRVFCFTSHGIQFMSCPFLVARNTSEPLNIYHLHAQHCPSPVPRFIFDNADNVSIYGAKNELQFSLATAQHSNNFRWYGGGGLYNPAAAHNAVQIIECTNYLVAAVDWQIYNEDGWTRHDYWNEMLKRDFEGGTTEPLVAYHNGQKVMPGPYDRPLLWQYGNPGNPGIVTASRFPIGKARLHASVLQVTLLSGNSSVIRLKIVQKGTDPQKVNVSVFDLRGRELFRSSTESQQAVISFDARRTGRQFLLCKIKSNTSEQRMLLLPSL